MVKSCGGVGWRVSVVDGIVAEAVSETWSLRCCCRRDMMVGSVLCVLMLQGTARQMRLLLQYQSQISKSLRSDPIRSLEC